MSSEQDNHGSTPAAWTTVVIIIAGFTLGGFAMVIANVPLFIAGGVVCVVGLVVGKAMQMMGMGSHRPTVDDVETTSAG